MGMSSVFHRFFYILQSLESICSFCNISANGCGVNLPWNGINSFKTVLSPENRELGTTNAAFQAGLNKWDWVWHSIGNQLLACGQLQAPSGNPALKPVLLLCWWCDSWTHRVICASGKELRNKAAGRFQIAVSSSAELHIQPLPGEWRILFSVLLRCGCTTQLYSCGDLAPQKCKGVKGMQ